MAKILLVLYALSGNGLQEMRTWEFDSLSECAQVASSAKLANEESLLICEYRQ